MKIYRYARDRFGEGPMMLHTARAIKQKTRYKLAYTDHVFDYRTYLPLDLVHETKEAAYRYAFDKLCHRTEQLRVDLERTENALDELRRLNPTKASEPLLRPTPR
jgi:hypothetical protein